jgi:hypothetical protein
MFARIYFLCFEGGLVKPKWGHAFRTKFDAEGEFSLNRTTQVWNDNRRVTTEARLAREGAEPVILYDASIVSFLGNRLRVTGFEQGMGERYTLQSWEVHLMHQDDAPSEPPAQR